MPPIFVSYKIVRMNCMQGVNDDLGPCPIVPLSLETGLQMITVGLPGPDDPDHLRESLPVIDRLSPFGSIEIRRSCRAFQPLFSDRICVCLFAAQASAFASRLPHSSASTVTIEEWVLFSMVCVYATCSKYLPM